MDYTEKIPPSPLALTCFYLFTSLLEQLMVKGLLSPEDVKSICSRSAGRASEAALTLSEQPNSDRALLIVLEEASKLAVTAFRVGQ
jgi:hypothetical protein